jgi:hypothetical protein
MQDQPGQLGSSTTTVVPQTVVARVDDEDDDDEIFEVEAIIGRRGAHKKSSDVEYLVRWKGYGPEEDTWQASADVVSAAELVADYERQRPPVASSSCSADAGLKLSRVRGGGGGSTASSGGGGGGGDGGARGLGPGGQGGGRGRKGGRGGRGRGRGRGRGGRGRKRRKIGSRGGGGGGGVVDAAVYPKQQIEYQFDVGGGSLQWYRGTVVKCLPNFWAKVRFEDKTTVNVLVASPASSPGASSPGSTLLLPWRPVVAEASSQRQGKPAVLRPVIPGVTARGVTVPAQLGAARLCAAPRAIASGQQPWQAD